MRIMKGRTLRSATRAAFRSALAIAAISLTAARVKAADDKLSGDFTPYYWGTGIKGTVTVGNRTANPDVSIGDVFDHSHGGFSFLSSLDYKRAAGYVQMDWAKLDNDRPAGNATVHTNTDFVDANFAGGYRFDGFDDKSSIDVMAGLKYTYVSTELQVANFSGTQNRDLIDAIAVLRPRYQFTPKFLFNPTFVFGGGQSDFVYELSPQFEYDFTEHFLGRVGYRRLHYKTHDTHGSLDLDMDGFIVGLGLKF